MGVVEIRRQGAGSSRAAKAQGVPNYTSLSARRPHPAPGAAKPGRRAGRDSGRGYRAGKTAWTGSSGAGRRAPRGLRAGALPGREARVRSGAVRFAAWLEEIETGALPRSE
jgi:hypothetical protein